MKQKTENSSDSGLLYLNMLLACSFILNLHDDLEQTTFYRQKLKSVGNNFKELIEKVVAEDLAKVWHDDEMIVLNLLRHQEALIKKITNMRPEELIIIDQLIDAYKKNPKEFCERNPIFLQELNNTKPSE